MVNPTLLSEQARLQQQEILRQAQVDRLYQQLKAQQPGLFQRLKHRLLAAVQ